MPRKKKTSSDHSPSKSEKSAAPSKADFIRAETKAGKKAAEIVEAGKAAGVALSIAHVYAVQSSDRKKAGKPTAAKAKRGPKPGARKALGGGGTIPNPFTPDEKHFLGLVKKIGVARAENLVGLASAFAAL